jgi:hypothetical protein
VTEIKNLQFQPLTFHLVGGKGIHLGPRGRREVSESDISPEIALAARRGLIQLLAVREPARSTPSTAPVQPPVASPAEAASAIEGSPQSTPDDEAAGTGRRKRK